MTHQLHEISMYFYCCQWCGRSLEAIQSDSSKQCSGVEGITHINYQRVKKRAEKALSHDVVLPSLVDEICKR